MSVAHVKSSRVNIETSVSFWNLHFFDTILANFMFSISISMNWIIFRPDSTFDWIVKIYRTPLSTQQTASNWSWQWPLLLHLILQLMSDSCANMSGHLSCTLYIEFGGTQFIEFPDEFKIHIWSCNNVRLRLPTCLVNLLPGSIGILQSIYIGSLQQLINRIL